MGQADEMPFSPHLSQSAKEKLKESSHMLDLTDHGLHRLLPVEIGLPPLLGQQFPAHPLHAAQGLGNPSLRCSREPVRMLDTIATDERLDVIVRAQLDILRTEIP